MLLRPTNISKYVLYNKGFISISEYHHPSCEECRQERKSIDVNHTSQLEAFIYFSGSGSGSGLRTPVPDPAFLVFHTPLRAQSRGRRSIIFQTQINLVPRALVTLVQRNGKTKTSGKMRLSSAFHWPSTERAQFNRKLRNNNFVPRFPI